MPLRIIHVIYEIYVTLWDEAKMILKCSKMYYVIHVVAF